MYTANEVDELKKRLEAEGKSKAEIVVSLAWACFGWPYVYGAWGAMCTPKERKKRAGYRPDKKEQIYGKCPVLKGEQVSCEGCPWQGTRCFDCRVQGYDRQTDDREPHQPRILLTGRNRQPHPRCSISRRLFFEAYCARHITRN